MLLNSISPQLVWHYHLSPHSRTRGIIIWKGKLKESFKRSLSDLEYFLSISNQNEYILDMMIHLWYTTHLFISRYYTIWVYFTSACKLLKIVSWNFSVDDHKWLLTKPEWFKKTDNSLQIWKVWKIVSKTGNTHRVNDKIQAKDTVWWMWYSLVRDLSFTSRTSKSSRKIHPSLQKSKYERNETTLHVCHVTFSIWMSTLLGGSLRR